WGGRRPRAEAGGGGGAPPGRARLRRRPRHRRREREGRSRGAQPRARRSAGDRRSGPAPTGPGAAAMTPRTLFDKVWDAHVVAAPDVAAPDGAPAILYIDLHLVHEVTSPQAFAGLRARKLLVRRPDRTIATMDHSTPTRPGGLALVDDQARAQVRQLEANCAEHGIALHRLGSAGHGIVHVIGPEQGLTQPGMTIVCGDSHT